MKSKKTGSPRRRINFAVDREEIEINSDWVDAVMASPSRPVAEETKCLSVPKDVFSAPSTNTATDEETTPGVECSSVEISAAVVESASVAGSATGNEHSPVEERATVVIPTPSDAPGESNATVAPITARVRIQRPRRIHRITDGLTPGQFAVYRLMYEAGQGNATRTYTGGYADLRRLTGLSKRGIQNIVAELQSKKVIRICQKPGYHRSETTSYEVPDEDQVLAVWAANGWRYALGKSKTFQP